MMSLSFAALALALVGCVSAANPGFQAALTNKGLDYARQVC